ncbi:hypothetical protein SDC9_206423 [bioreactor metagenome]|uniref:Uncharacterized protein n=1 Tax=bioreactor metagenome TaxID=1076179 RepID=A0A645J507_9ZZZZ
MTVAVETAAGIAMSVRTDGFAVIGLFAGIVSFGAAVGA